MIIDRLMKIPLLTELACYCLYLNECIRLLFKERDDNHVSLRDQSGHNN